MTNLDLFGQPVTALVEPKPAKSTPGGRIRPGQQRIGHEIKSVSFEQDEVLADIIDLYVAGSTFDIDASYGYGEFYRSIPRPLLRYDIDPKRPEAMLGDSRALPVRSSSAKSIIFDPPFVVTNQITSEEYVMGRRYGGYRSVEQLREHYQSSLVEFARVLRPRGILVFKCQDFVSGRMNYFIHNEVQLMAERAGFRAVDLFILIAKNRFKGGMKTQNHARKYHSYFWVFRRKSKKIAQQGGTRRRTLYVGGGYVQPFHYSTGAPTR